MEGEDGVEEEYAAELEPENRSPNKLRALLKSCLKFLGQQFIWLFLISQSPFSPARSNWTKVFDRREMGEEKRVSFWRQIRKPAAARNESDFETAKLRIYLVDTQNKGSESFSSRKV